MYSLRFCREATSAANRLPQWPSRVTVPRARSAAATRDRRCYGTHGTRALSNLTRTAVQRRWAPPRRLPVHDALKPRDVPRAHDDFLLFEKALDPTAPNAPPVPVQTIGHD